MHRLEPRRLADDLPFELALPFEGQARGAADGRGVERLLLLVEQSLQPLEAVVHFGFVDLIFHRRGRGAGAARIFEAVRHRVIGRADDIERRLKILFGFAGEADDEVARDRDIGAHGTHALDDAKIAVDRSEEHTSELQSLMRISYAVFCLTKQNIHHLTTYTKHN